MPESRATVISCVAVDAGSAISFRMGVNDTELELLRAVIQHSTTRRKERG